MKEVSLLFVARLVVPLVVMFSLSYICKRLGFINSLPTPPNDWNSQNTGHKKIGIAHNQS